MTASKNYIFPLDEEEIGMIRMIEESGQVQKTKLQDRKELKKKIKNLTKNIKPYEFVENQIYTSKYTQKEEIIKELGFEEASYGIYKMPVFEKTTYQRVLNKTKPGELPNID